MELSYKFNILASFVTAANLLGSAWGSPIDTSVRQKLDVFVPTIVEPNSGMVWYTGDVKNVSFCLFIGVAFYSEVGKLMNVLCSPFFCIALLGNMVRIVFCSCASYNSSNLARYNSGKLPMLLRQSATVLPLS